MEYLLVEGPVEARAVKESWTTRPPVDLSLMALALPGHASASAGLGPHSIHGRTLGLGPSPWYQSWILASTVPVPPVWQHFVRLHS